jgi:hypothetical protein
MALGFEALGLHYIERPAAGTHDGQVTEFSLGQFSVALTASYRFQVSYLRVVAL